LACGKKGSFLQEYHRRVIVRGNETLSVSPAAIVFLFAMALLMRTAGAATLESKQCGIRNAYTGTVFSLSIDRVRRVEFRNTIFYLCGRKWPDASFLLVRSESGQKTLPDVNKRVLLSSAKFDELATLYEAALDLNLRDDTDGMDGSSWCLDTTRVSVSFRGCFWSPTYSGDQRGLGHLAALGRALWHLAELGPAVGQLD
jgi:hypothetical protein